MILRFFVVEKLVPHHFFEVLWIKFHKRALFRVGRRLFSAADTRIFYLWTFKWICGRSERFVVVQMDLQSFK